MEIFPCGMVAVIEGSPNGLIVNDFNVRYIDRHIVGVTKILLSDRQTPIYAGQLPGSRANVCTQTDNHIRCVPGAPNCCIQPNVAARAHVVVPLRKCAFRLEPRCRPESLRARRASLVVA